VEEGRQEMGWGWGVGRGSIGEGGERRGRMAQKTRMEYLVFVCSF
jgi:hypothetical protein